MLPQQSENRTIMQSICQVSHLLCSTIPYTRVNKRMRLFAKLQENMRLIPNMCLIARGKIDHTSKTAMPSLVARGLTANE